MPDAQVTFDRRAALSIAAVLMIVTYLAFSLRTLLDPLDPGELFSAKRLAAAAVGTATFWVVARSASCLSAYHRRERIRAVTLRVIAAATFVLFTRLAWDVIVTGETEAMVAKNLRWIIAWSGYFVAALMAYFAIAAGRLARRRSASAFASREDAVRWFATELSTWPEVERRAIAAMLDAPRDYECADPLFAPVAGD